MLLHSLFPPQEELRIEYHLPKNSLRMAYYYPLNTFSLLARYWRLGLRVANSKEDEFASRVKRESILREWLAAG